MNSRKTTLSTELRGIGGAIVDAVATDIAEIEELEFPVYARGVSAITTKALATDGEINTPVQVGGVPVNPGDLLVADVNGILVLPQELASKIIEAREKREVWTRAELQKGASLSELTKAAEKLAAQLRNA